MLLLHLREQDRADEAVRIPTPYGEVQIIGAYFREEATPIGMGLALVGSLDILGKPKDTKVKAVEVTVDPTPEGLLRLLDQLRSDGMYLQTLAVRPDDFESIVGKKS